MTNSSGEQFKKGLDKSFSNIKLNSDTMIDLMSAKQGVKEEDDMSEEWSEKYKKSIDCSHPKGFSQRAHCQGRKKKDKSETKEATGSGSVGGYSSPAMWAKSTKKKDWGPSRKPQLPGGKFVSVKDKCTKFPYCNKGDINALNISKNESVAEAIKKVSKKMNISENVIKAILEHEYEKLSKRAK